MDEELKEIINLARKAGEKILEFYSRSFKVYTKKDSSLVTEADLASEQIILSVLRRYGYGILSEESRDRFVETKREKLWIIDPLDGTNDFLQRTGEFSVMIGLVEKGKPVKGVVYCPILDKLYFAQKGKGAFLQQKGYIKKIKVSEISDIFCSKFVVSRSHLSEEETEFLKKNNVDYTKKGSIGLKLAMISEGQADGYINFSKKTCQWDTCAPEIILEEAGGRITDLKGKMLLYGREPFENINGLIASNKLIHSKIISNL
ncbi:3'(2'),5'-bisphosphate nucleotidase CysQ [bacterium]|nr:3'(2'),5'-bisphosphate nucleotidase CysQ [bacterium]